MGWILLLLALACPRSASAAPGEVLNDLKISSTSGAFDDVLADFDAFGSAVAEIGDVDGDGNYDLAVGVPYDDDGDDDAGAVWILFLDATDQVKAKRKISATTGGLSNPPDLYDSFGFAVAGIGDVDGDGTPDLAVGSIGCAWILFLNDNGTVGADERLCRAGFFGFAFALLGDLDSNGTPELAVGAPAYGGSGAVYIESLDASGFESTLAQIDSANLGVVPGLDSGDNFGRSVATLGDLGSNGSVDIIVGAPYDDDGGQNRGAIYVIQLASTGSPTSTTKISSSFGGFGAGLDDEDRFGWSAATIGDFNGLRTIAVGAPWDDDGGANSDRGAVWLLGLTSSGTLSPPSKAKISDTAGGFGGGFDDYDRFGFALAGLTSSPPGSVPKLSVGVPLDDAGGTNHGAIWNLELNAAVTTVVAETKIGSSSGNLNSKLKDDDRFGSAVVNIGDVDGDGVNDLAVGAYHDSDGPGPNLSGSVWILFMTADGEIAGEHRISQTTTPALGLSNSDFFGRSVAALGDLNDDGVPDIAVGATGDDTGAATAGAVYVLFLKSNGTVDSVTKIADGVNGLPPGTLGDGDSFGSAAAGLGLFDGDAVEDLAVGAFRDDTGPSTQHGAVYILNLDTDGTVLTHTKIANGLNGFTGTLDAGDWFGSSVAALGDVDGNGVTDLAVGAPSDDDGGDNNGAVWVLLMSSSGTVSGAVKISETDGGYPSGGFGGVVGADAFGSSVAGLGDLDGDGIVDLLVGAEEDNDGPTDAGSIWVLFLNSTGRVLGFEKTSDTEGNLSYSLETDEGFGSGVTNLGDLDGDGHVEIAVGAYKRDDGGLDRGAVYLLTLETAFCGDGSIASIEDCDLGASNGDPSVCCSASCDFKTFGSSCGDGTDTECTNPDTCNGAGVCQPNHATSGAPCGDAGSECVVQDTCNGAGSCSDNGFVTTGTACGDPGDTECTNPDTCNGAGACLSNHESAGAPCGDAGSECVVQDTCNGAGSCSDNGFVTSGTACGDPGDTECTNPDTCDGAGGCQPNDETSGTFCGDAGTECIVQDTCDGAGACGDNGFFTSGTACGDPSDTECTNPDTCNGTGSCQPNHEISGAPCGDAGTECVVQDTCDGSGACSDNGFFTSGTACGDPSDTECTNPDTCDGAGSCQDNHEASGALCGDAGSECVVQDTCDGAGSCADNGFEPAGLACSDDGNVCTDDACDGAGACAHPNNTVSCNDGDACTEVDTCSGGSCIGSVPPECDDDDLCTQNACDPVLGCVFLEEPLDPGLCLSAGRAQLQVKNDAFDAKDQLKWKWGKGDGFDAADLATPDADTTYALCIYDTTGGVPSLAGSLRIDPNAAWESKGAKGFNYKDKEGLEDGVQKVQLKTGDAGKAKLQIAGKGANLVTPVPLNETRYFSQDPRVTVQLVTDDPAAACWTSEFTLGGTSKNDGAQFKAK